MSSVSDRERSLILDLLLGRVRTDEFYRMYPLEPGQGSVLGRDILVRGLQQRDKKAVEYGLYLGHKFGISLDYLPLLIALAAAPWHERHEDVIDALAKLKSPSSVDALVRTATTSFPYREYDEVNSLRTKCVRTLGKIESKEAIAGLGALLNDADPQLEKETLAELWRFVNNSMSAELHDTAIDVINSFSYRK